MAFIRVRGRLEPLKVSEERGEKLKQLFVKGDEETMKSRIEVNGWVGSVSDIIGIDPEQETTKTPQSVIDGEKIRDDWDALPAAEKKRRTALRMGMMRGKITEKEYWDGLGKKKTQVELATEVFS